MPYEDRQRRISDQWTCTTAGTAFGGSRHALGRADVDDRGPHDHVVEVVVVAVSRSPPQVMSRNSERESWP